MRELLAGQSPNSALVTARRELQSLFAKEAELFHFKRLLESELASLGEAEIQSSGYVVHTLEASLWCFLTTRGYEECVLKAVNLGEDTDTTGCVAGGLAGIYYGFEAIPSQWRSAMARTNELGVLFERFSAICAPRG